MILSVSIKMRYCSLIYMSYVPDFRIWSMAIVSIQSCCSLFCPILKRCLTQKDRNPEPVPLLCYHVKYLVISHIRDFVILTDPVNFLTVKVLSTELFFSLCTSFLPIQISRRSQYQSVYAAFQNTKRNL